MPKFNKLFISTITIDIFSLWRLRSRISRLVLLIVGGLFIPAITRATSPITPPWIVSVSHLQLLLILIVSASVTFGCLYWIVFHYAKNANQPRKSVSVVQKIFLFVSKIALAGCSLVLVLIFISQRYEKFYTPWEITAICVLVFDIFLILIATRIAIEVVRNIFAPREKLKRVVYNCLSAGAMVLLSWYCFLLVRSFLQTLLSERALVWPDFFTLFFLIVSIFLVCFIFYNDLIWRSRINSMLVVSYIVVICATIIFFSAKTIIPQFTVNDFVNQKYSGQFYPSHIITVTDAYMISFVGKEEFKKNYQLYTNIDLHSLRTCQTSNYCTLQYVFVPGLIYGDSLYQVYYSNGLADNIDPSSDTRMPNCTKDVHNCGFTLSKENLVTIAQKNNVSSPHFRIVMKDDKLVVEVKHSYHHYSDPPIMYIDPYTAEILISK